MAELDGDPTAAVLAEARARGLTTSLDTVWDATGRWERLLPSLPHLACSFQASRKALPFRVSRSRSRSPPGSESAAWGRWRSSWAPRAASWRARSSRASWMLRQSRRSTAQGRATPSLQVSCTATWRAGRSSGRLRLPTQWAPWRQPRSGRSKESEGSRRRLLWRASSRRHEPEAQSSGPRSCKMKDRVSVSCLVLTKRFSDESR